MEKEAQGERNTIIYTRYMCFTLTMDMSVTVAREISYNLKKEHNQEILDLYTHPSHISYKQVGFKRLLTNPLNLSIKFDLNSEERLIL